MTLPLLSLDGATADVLKQVIVSVFGVVLLYFTVRWGRSTRRVQHQVTRNGHSGIPSDITGDAGSADMVFAELQLIAQKADDNYNAITKKMEENVTTVRAWISQMEERALLTDKNAAAAAAQVEVTRVIMFEALKDIQTKLKTSEAEMQKHFEIELLKVQGRLPPNG